MPKLNLRSALRIKLPAGEIKQLKGDGFAWPEAGASAPPAGPAAWFTPADPIQVTPSSPPQFYKGTFAWSYRFAAGELDAPPTLRMFYTGQGCTVFVNGHNDVSGRSVAASGLSWAWSPATFTFVGPDVHLLFPGGTNNFVFVFDTAGGLSGGATAQVWHNGVLVMQSTSAMPDFAMWNLFFMGDENGVNQIPGETQGYWWSNDTVVDPATVFAELFDGANGMRDLVDTTIGGVVPDAVQIGPA